MAPPRFVSWGLRCRERGRTSTLGEGSSPLVRRGHDRVTVPSSSLLDHDGCCDAISPRAPPTPRATGSRARRRMPRARRVRRRARRAPRSRSGRARASFSCCCGDLRLQLLEPAVDRRELLLGGATVGAGEGRRLRPLSRRRRQRLPRRGTLALDGARRAAASACSRSSRYCSTPRGRSRRCPSRIANCRSVTRSTR